MNIVDRRLNPSGKNLPNRQRFIERAKADVRKAVSDSIASRKVSDVGKDGEKVKVRHKGTAEPSFHHGRAGDHNHVIPGNPGHVKGDRIPKPAGGQGAGGNGKAGSEGADQDGFEFVLTREEFLDIFFADLALPDMVKAAIQDLAKSKPHRAGHAREGSPTARNVPRTMRNALSRRIALERPSKRKLAQLEAAVVEAEAAGSVIELEQARAKLERGLTQTRRVPWVDPVDERYNRFELRPEPISSAVMFCLMDVSGSMSEHMKDLAKRFFMLLYLFLERNYERIHVVFIRHTEKASEVDEDTFFRSKDSGGTVVSTALGGTAARPARPLSGGPL